MRTVGVVIPTYNRAGFIGETLDAILAQTRSPQEVLVVDDGSTDNTQEVLKTYRGRIRTLIVPNGGDLYARNIGLGNLSTDLVAFCDSDDLWEPNFLEKMAGQWDHAADIFSCYADFRILRDAHIQERTKFADAPPEFFDGCEKLSGNSAVFRFGIVDKLLTFQPFFPSCMMVDRSSFMKVGGWDEGVSRCVGTDFATALRVADRPPLAVVFEPLVRIRKHSGNFSGDTERMNFGDASILEYVLKTRPELSQYEALVRHSIADRRAAAIDASFARRDFRTFNAHYCLLPGSLRTGKRRLKHVISLGAAMLGASDTDR